MGDRIAVIEDGVLHQVGTPHDVYERPADLVVADFLGSPPMNLLQVKAEQGPGRVCFLGAGFRWSTDDLRLRHLTATAPASLILGIRPERIRLDVGAGAPAALEAIIDRVDRLGRETLVHLRLGAAHVDAWAEPGFTGRNGQALLVQLDVDAVRLFDASGGRALD